VITTNILQRILRVKSSRGFGTAFTIDRDRGKKQYVVSAKHIFGEENTFEFAKINTNPNTSEGICWKQPSHELPLCNETEDVVVFPLKTPITPRHQLLLDRALGLGQDVYFLGFPFGMALPGGEILNNGLPTPFVKKGIIAGYKYPGAGLPFGIWLDAHNNLGFSGGPVVVVDDRKVHVIGIVSAYNLEPVMRVSQNSPPVPVPGMVSNSGLAYAPSIRNALKLIEEYEKST